ncbi:tripartite tricarboxylate transporter TctB family protein [Nonomuraea sp. NPDC003804]|uniref:tripartite tricarboxylate transporter TctB family protein n=1 Tax=Nonomuraea sp. NPDC003804 TaxID=3154547 RepID=UPI0033AB806D
MSSPHEQDGATARGAVPAAQDPRPGPAGPPPDDRAPAGEAGKRGWWRPEMGLSVTVLALGVLVIVGTLDVSAATSRLGLGPRFFPILIGGALILIGAFYTLDVVRGGRGDPEESEDVDADAPADWKSVGLVSGIFLGFTAALSTLGWVLSASLLFFGLSVALGAENKVKAAVIAVVLGVLSYVVFVNGLGVSLPGGLLQGVI